ncbi:MAG: AarF/ABC1/UbiB kinase family protein [Actinomycetia bacterium]|nr:AarF/ABC1/UbiB kinase family protein [Actinomycetes bacterium]
MAESDFSLFLDVSGFIDVLLILIVIGWLTGRILGVKRGFFRAIVAGLVGLIAGQILVLVQFPDEENFSDPEDLLRLGLGFFGYVLLVTMITSLVLEAVLKPRDQRRRPRLPHPIRWIKRKFALLQRLQEIALAARRHGLVGRKYASRAALSSPEGARALRLTLEDCGGMFIKFGQIAAGRDDFLPPAVIAELGLLRTSVKPLPIATVNSVMASELGENWRETFDWFDNDALAAASIGVIHEARLVGGEPVIVKIQRPGIKDIVARDSRVLIWGAKQLERTSGYARSLGIVDLAEELVEGVTEELDFTREATNNLAMRTHRANDVGVKIPLVNQELTTERVLVMQEVIGEPVSDDAAVDTCGVDRSELADRLLKSFLDQILGSGVYHADPHPGNVLIDSDGTLWLIDFGAVGFIDPITLEALQQMAIGFTLRDPGMLARAVRRMAGGQVELDIPSLEYDMGQVLTQVEDGGFGPTAIGEVVHVLQRHSVRVPRALTVLGRAAVTMEGTLRVIQPGYSMSAEAPRLVKTTPTLDESEAAVTKEFLRAIPSLRPLPQLVEDIAVQTRSGDLGIRIERFSGRDRVAVDRWLDRILWASLSMAGLIGSALILLASAMTTDGDVALYLRWIGFLGLIVSSAMQMRVVARVLQRRTDDDDHF